MKKLKITTSKMLQQLYRQSIDYDYKIHSLTHSNKNILPTDDHFIDIYNKMYPEKRTYYYIYRYPGYANIYIDYITKPFYLNIEKIIKGMLKYEKN